MKNTSVTGCCDAQHGSNCEPAVSAGRRLRVQRVPRAETREAGCLFACHSMHQSYYFYLSQCNEVCQIRCLNIL